MIGITASNFLCVCRGNLQGETEFYQWEEKIDDWNNIVIQAQPEITNQVLIIHQDYQFFSEKILKANDVFPKEIIVKGLPPFLEGVERVCVNNRVSYTAFRDNKLLFYSFQGHLEKSESYEDSWLGSIEFEGPIRSMHVYEEIDGKDIIENWYTCAKNEIYALDDEYIKTENGMYMFYGGISNWYGANFYQIDLIPFTYEPETVLCFSSSGVFTISVYYEIHFYIYKFKDSEFCTTYQITKETLTLIIQCGVKKQKILVYEFKKSENNMSQENILPVLHSFEPHSELLTILPSTEQRKYYFLEALGNVVSYQA